MIILFLSKNWSPSGWAGLSIQAGGRRGFQARLLQGRRCCRTAAGRRPRAARRPASTLHGAGGRTMGHPGQAEPAVREHCRGRRGVFDRAPGAGGSRDGVTVPRGCCFEEPSKRHGFAIARQRDGKRVPDRHRRIAAAIARPDPDFECMRSVAADGASTPRMLPAPMDIVRLPHRRHGVRRAGTCGHRPV